MLARSQQLQNDMARLPTGDVNASNGLQQLGQVSTLGSGKLTPYLLIHTRHDGELFLPLRMTKHEFRLRFSPSIRVNVNWRLLDEDAVTLRSVELELPEHLNLLWTPWCSTGAPAHKETETLSVTGAASDLSLLGEHREGVEN